MSSTNKTAHLQLNQWEQNDPVIRTDFNADNAKVDAAFDSIPVNLLKRGTLSAPSDAIQVSLSDVDISLYRELFLDATLTGADEQSGGSMLLAVNGVDTGHSYHYLTLAQTSEYQTADIVTIPSCFYPGRTGVYRVRLIPLDSYVLGIADTLVRYYNSDRERFSHQCIRFAADTVTAATLTTLELRGKFAAGGRYALYGIKK